MLKICNKFKIKLIYFSTSYVYEGTDGNYKETDPVKPEMNYSKSKLGNKVSFKLFKSVTKLLDAYEKKKPDLVGFSNYTWSYSLSQYAGQWIKEKFPTMPIIMGGPNIRLEEKGIE